jgi:catechol 2,3-dioxygenase-like lactoylglutathione lyase family enzyme
MPAIDATLRKFHASLNVSDLERAVAFYRVLLGTEPAKVRPDYAKFDLADPPLVLSLAPGQQPQTGGHLNHVGLRVRTADELVDVQRRLEAAGMPTQREEGVECCYARQTKFWINDPDGTLWEIYVFHEDIDEHGHGSPPRVEAVPAQPLASAEATSWRHRLTDHFPPALPHGDGTLNNVELEGSINAAFDAANRDRFMRETLRVLRPGGSVHVHGLAGDRRVSDPVSLPGPAAAVKHVPAVEEVVDELASAGFVDIVIEKLSPTAYFVVGGVPCRELRVVAKRPGARGLQRTHEAVYLGPMAQVVDDSGTIFRRGAVTAIDEQAWERLARSAMKNDFALRKTAARQEAACCGDKPAAAQPAALVR